ncbi:hypothetical protein EDC02_5025 [Micromonospora sp. Llam0]|nr:hypothetical protein [Micromonospora sp. Llam0]ROO63015.1 hypothetical protein EDC02_5025 [Micromonospora sp. Llam0]
MLTPAGQSPLAAAPGSDRALIDVTDPPTQVVLARPITRHTGPDHGTAG